MAVHILIGFAIAAGWALSLLIHPFGRCWLCRGRRVHVHGRRVRTCQLCKGTGRRQRTGSRTVHRIRRHVVAEYRRTRALSREQRARETAPGPHQIGGA